MKQKRKVKSLISSDHGSNKLLATLLFLIGGILVFGAVALFTSSVGVVSAEDDPNNLQYENGIEDKVEILLNLKFARDGLTDTVNEMYFSGDTFYMKGNQGIVRAEPAGGSIAGYVNYLGGEWDGMNIASDNVTVVGGKNIRIYQNNADTTILGGINNEVASRDSAGAVAPVMVGGQNNNIGGNQMGSAIIGGKDNKISSNGSYDFILGGENNRINSSNVIVGGANVVVNQPNVFVFNDGEATFTPQSPHAFYLNLKNGLGLNKAAVNKGVDSKGAVSFGQINISTACEEEDVGVQGRWDGCLVGCTLASAHNENRWEMIDHGDTCEEKCKAPANARYCMVNPIEPTPPTDYPSECTVGGVDTSHSTQCAENRLGVYENVMFETFLIDSDDNCENYDNHQNKCIFKCDKDYHLTGNVAGNSDSTKKCYKDCTLPWNGEKIKHNEIREAYNAKTVACSNTEWVFPIATAIVNVPTREYPNTRTLNGLLKTTAAAGKSYESCTNYTHKKTLICNNGTLYIAELKNSKRRATTTEALGSTGKWYGYDVCTTKDYKCPTSVYNLTQNYITTNSIAKDTVSWNNTDRSTSLGTRGQYKLCLDWTPSVGNSECKVGTNGANGTVANNYHYQLVRCNNYYSTGTDNNPYECKASCQMKDSSGNWTYKDSAGNEYKHNRVITGYKLDTELCTELGNGTCHADTIVCDDGTWKMWTKDGPENTEYLYRDCSLTPYKCDDRFDIAKSNKEYRQGRYTQSVYESCTPYSAKNGNKFKCTADENEYDLIYCNGEYHTENNRYCISNYDTIYCTNKPSNSTYYIGYNNYHWNAAWNAAGNNWVHTYGDCSWYCNGGYHEENGGCEYNSRKYSCSATYSSLLPEHATWDHEYEEWEWFESGGWTKMVSCTYTCDPKYEGSDCGTYVPDGCSSVCGTLTDGQSCESYDRCDSTKKTATCSDGIMQGEQGDYTQPNYGCSGCYSPACGNVADGGECESYAKCSSTKVVSTCSDGRWGTPSPEAYSSPNQACPNSCTGCPGKTSVANGGECESYDTCSSTKVVSTCDDGEWTPQDPKTYSSPNQGCGYSCQGSHPSGVTTSPVSPTDNITDWFCATNLTQACSYTCPSEKQCNSTYTNCESVPGPSYSCQGTPPPDVTTSSVPPSNNTTYWTCATDTTQACTYTCNGDNMECNGSKTGCEERHDESLCGSTKNSCTNGGTATNPQNGTNAYTWDCPDETGCSVTKKTCSDYVGVTFSPTGTCYRSEFMDDGYGGWIQCYTNGCDAMGYEGYTCVSGINGNECPSGYPLYQLAGGGYCYTCPVTCPASGHCGISPVGTECKTYSRDKAADCSQWEHTSVCQADGTWLGEQAEYGGCDTIDPCIDYPFSACPTTHAQCFQCPSDSSKYNFSCKPSYNDCVSTLRGSNPDWYVKTYCPDNANCGSCQTYVFDGGQGCKADQTLYVVTSCKDSNYTVEDGSCISCAQATQGWTQGTPNQYNCHEYYTKYVCGSNYYIDRGYACGANQTCSNGTCMDVECQGTIVDQANVQYYQETLGYSCNCDGSVCCCDAP